MACSTIGVSRGLQYDTSASTPGGSMPKRDLIFRKPLMNAAGTLGFAPDTRAPVPWEQLGAFVTNPVSMRPRKAAASPAVMEYPGGFLMHSGLPNPGLPSVLARFSQRWRDAALPVIVHIMADRPEQTRQMVQALERFENVMAVELGFAPLLAPDIPALVVEMCRAELPLIVSLPADQLLDAGGRLLELGAAALSLSAPRGALPADGSFVTGRLFGPARYPEALEAVRSAAKLGFPVIGGEGVVSEVQVEAMLAAGALAVQMDAALWLPRP
jgi:dihydroorotate dehydrogenase (NAD+) catalytic subunit